MWQPLLDAFAAIGEGLFTVFSFGLWRPTPPRLRRRHLYDKTLEEALAEDYRKIEKDMEKVLGKGNTHFPHKKRR